MANAKQKQGPEGANRSPGKSRFSIPKKEVPPIDGSYLERLFADYEKQSQELETRHSAAPTEESVATTTETSSAAAPDPATTLTPEWVQDTLPKALSVEPLPLKVAKTQTIIAGEPGAFQPSVAPTPEVTHPKVPAASVKEIPAQRPVEFSSEDKVLIEKLKKKHRLGKGEINVLRTMIRLCRDSGSDYCYVKIPQLMASSGLKERQTQLVLRSLRELEMIEKLADYSNLDRLGTKYRVKFESFLV